MEKTSNEEQTITVPLSHYHKLIAFRFKDVRPLFPKKSKMAREFADSITPEKWKSLMEKK